MHNIDLDNQSRGSSHSVRTLEPETHHIPYGMGWGITPSSFALCWLVVPFGGMCVWKHSDFQRKILPIGIFTAHRC